MPQMAPYNWLSLFILFSLILIYLISFNHFMIYPMKKFSLKLKKINFIWMW